ncbi:hypothetical protein ACJX0J_020886, partial [Zea mays]
MALFGRNGNHDLWVKCATFAEPLRSQKLHKIVSTMLGPLAFLDHEATQEGLNYSVPSHQDFAPVHDGILEDVVFPVEYGEACQ